MNSELPLFTLYYYENLIIHLLTKDFDYLNKVYNYILLLENSNNTELANALKEEVKTLVYKETKINPSQCLSTMINI